MLYSVFNNNRTNLLVAFRYQSPTNVSSRHREAELDRRDSGTEKISAVTQRRKGPEQAQRNPAAAARSGVYSIHPLMCLIFITIHMSGDEDVCHVQVEIRDGENRFSIERTLISASKPKQEIKCKSNVYLLFQLSDKEEALAHQRKVSYMLARSYEDLEKRLQAELRELDVAHDGSEFTAEPECKVNSEASPCDDKALVLDQHEEKTQTEGQEE